MQHRSPDLLDDGALAAPGLAWRLDPDTGLFRPGSDRIQVVQGGDPSWEFTTGGHLKPIGGRELGAVGANMDSVYTQEVHSDADLILRTSTTARWMVGDTTGTFSPGADNTYDIGTAGASVKDVWLDGVLKGDYSQDTQSTFGTSTNWTAVTTSPTNRVWTAVYMQRGKHLTAWINLTAGVGFTAGNGQYIILLQGTVDTTYNPTGMAVGEWSATIGGVNTGGVVRRQGVNQVRCTLAAGGTFGSANAMAAGDSLMLHVEYAIA